jgi:hypothetical protein
MTDNNYQIINESSTYNCAKKPIEKEGILVTTRANNQIGKIE